LTAIYLALAPATAALLSYVLTPLASKLAHRVGAVDLPGPRKVHTSPTPRLGGVAVVTAQFTTLAACWWISRTVNPIVPLRLLVPLAIGLGPIFIVSCLDDARSMPVYVKLLAQLLGAGVAVATGFHLSDTVHVFDYPISLGVFTLPVSMLWIVSVTNAFNLVDGLDGLSAGLGLISTASLAIVAVLTQNHDVLAISLVTVGALLGFIPYNLNPARVFLGDSGSTAIGFCIACLTLQRGGKLPSGLAVAVPVLVIGVPLADTVLSIARRVIRGWRHGQGIRIFQADSEHIHHRLLRLGLDHRRAVLFLYGAGVVTAGVGIVSLLTTSSNASLLLMALLVGAAVGVSWLDYDEFAVLKPGAALCVYDTPAVRSGHFKLLVDIALVLGAFYLAVALKYDDWVLSAHRTLWLTGAAILSAFNLATFLLFGVYRRNWRFASIRDVIDVNCAVLVSSLATFVAIRLVLDPDASGTLFGMFAILHCLGTSAARASFRILSELKDTKPHEAGRRTVIYGAGERGTMALREMRRNPDLRLLPVGFVDDDRSLVGHWSNGLRVLGGGGDLRGLVAEHRVNAVVIALDALTPAQLVSALHVCSMAGAEPFQFTVGVQALEEIRTSSPAAHWSDFVGLTLS
jgi:UDP-GlcNAc:undecaprenyl-phosphate GlcNAc-1-phosphate transferase